MLSIIDPITAIYKLRQYKPITSPIQAISYLEERLLTYQLDIIYQHFFPAEFAQSTASEYPDDLKDPKAYSPKEMELLDLINENLFPINTWYHNQSNQRLYAIPLIAEGIDWEAEEFDPMYLSLGWQALSALCLEGRRWIEGYDYDLDGEDSGELAENADCYFSVTGAAFNSIASPEKVNKNRFKKLCAKAKHPFNLLPLAIELMEHKSGNIWLDLYFSGLDYDERASGLLWTVENVQLLATAYQECTEIWQKINQLIDWLESDIEPNFQEVLKLWNRSSRRKLPEKF